MNNKLAIILFLVSVLFSSVSQVMLKISSQKKYDALIKEYINPIVIAAYFIFFVCTFINIYSLKIVPLYFAPMLEATGLIFVAILSKLILKENISKAKIFGLVLIFVGIIVSKV